MNPRYGHVRQRCGPREARKAALWAAEEWRHGRVPVHLTMPYNIGSSAYVRRIMDSWLCSGFLELSSEYIHRENRLRFWPERRIGLDVREHVDTLVHVHGCWGGSQVKEAHAGFARLEYGSKLRYDWRLWLNSKLALLTISTERVPDLRDALHSAELLGTKLLETG